MGKSVNENQDREEAWLSRSSRNNTKAAKKISIMIMGSYLNEKIGFRAIVVNSCKLRFHSVL